MLIWLTQSLYPDPSQQGSLALAITAVSLAFAVPNVLIAPIAGAYADRHDRRRTMVVCDVLSGLLSLLLAVLLLTHHLGLVWLLVICVAAAAVQAFHSSSFDASYFMLVTKKQLPRANGMMQTTWALAGILAPAIAAMLLALPNLARQGRLGGAIGHFLAGMTDGAALAVGVDALTFFAAATTLLFLAIPSPKRTDLVTSANRKTIWADVKEGALYIWHRRPLLWLLSVFAVVNLLSSPLGVTMPLLVKFRLAADWAAKGYSYETAFALISTVFALGGVVGGVIISLWGGLRKRRVWGVIVPLIPEGILIAVFALSRSLYLSAVAAFLISFVGPSANAHSQAIWQTQTPPELQGRVFSVRRLIAQFTAPVGTAASGPLVGALGSVAVLAVAGLAQAAFCFSQVLNRHLLKVEDRDYLEGLAARAAAGEAGGAAGATAGAAADSTTTAPTPVAATTEVRSGE